MSKPTPSRTLPSADAGDLASMPAAAIRRRPGDDGPLDPPDPLDPLDPPDRPDRPDPLDPPPTPPEPPALATPSITSWTRLEPHCRQADMQTSVAARVFDPLWLMARQWQVGEFQGEDAGSPVTARTRATTAQLSRSYLGALPPNTATQGAPYDPQTVPLEVLAERQRVRLAAGNPHTHFKLGVEAGLHFLRLLEARPLSKDYRDAFIARFALQLPDAAALGALDAATQRYLQSMAGRALDGRLLYDGARSTGSAALAQDSALRIAAADRAEVEIVAQQWLAWVDALFSEPTAGSGDAWQAPRMEYALSVSGRLSADPIDEFTLTASEFYGGQLDWASFDRNAEVNMGTLNDRRFAPLVETTVPAPVSFRGAPAARFWEFEDARIEYGLLPVGPTDLAQLLMIEYAGSYGNDWFVVPLDLPVGSITRVDSLVVTDTFGVRTLLRPLGDPALPRPYWSAWQMASTRRAGTEPSADPVRNLFFLPPSLGRSLESPAIEEVLFLRDEMANVAWAIERKTENGIGQPVDAAPPAAAPAAPAAPGTVPHYRLSTTVPANWIPLLPVQLAAQPATDPPRVVSRLKRGAVLQPDGTHLVHRAQGRVLNAGGDLLMYDEEVPREGLRVTRHYQMARWLDGSTWTWLSYRKAVGRGEGSSGLRFDSVEDGSG
ncbi:hypothetical protein WMF31_22825 [Sorangium sp. So ce1036]|uniref:hypothetical protein n=1 Tax=Sorangium sp. So ce1036 TaxID=3133328 RepID=UPI003F031473